MRFLRAGLVFAVAGLGFPISTASADPTCVPGDTRCQTANAGRGKTRVISDIGGVTGTAEASGHRPGGPAANRTGSTQRPPGSGSGRASAPRTLSPQDAARAARGLPPAESCGGLLMGPAVGCGAPSDPPPAAAPAPPPPDPVTVARQAVARLDIPAPISNTGPDHNQNEWKMLPVGFPVWLWTTGPDEYSTTVTEQGLTMTLSARRTTTEFSLGDGTTQFCGMTTPYYPAVKPGTPSPSCGHRYRLPSGPSGYPITATTHWQVTWQALGQTGTLPFQRAGPARVLPVGELVSVRTRD